MFISDVHAITPFNNTHKHVCNVKIDNSEVTVQEEYKVYDFNGILAGLSLSIADQTNALADLRLEGAQAPQAQAQLILRGSKYQQTTVSSAP